MSVFRFSCVGIHWRFVNCRLRSPSSRVSDSEDLGWAPRICTSTKFLSAAAVLGNLCASWPHSDQITWDSIALWPPYDTGSNLQLGLVETQALAKMSATSMRFLTSVLSFTLNVRCWRHSICWLLCCFFYILSAHPWIQPFSEVLLKKKKKAKRIS